MQTEFKDGSKGKIITAETVEELVPKIKEALANPDVKCVRVFKNGSKIQAEEEVKTAGDFFGDMAAKEVKTTDASSMTKPKLQTLGRR